MSEHIPRAAGADSRLLTDVCVVRGDGGQKPMAGDSGAVLGEGGSLIGDEGALIMFPLSLVGCDGQNDARSNRMR